MTAYMRWGLVLVLLAGGLGCAKKARGPGGPPPGMAMRVKAEAARVGPLQETIALVASVQAQEAIEVKSEIDGIIASVNFQEGQPVKAGDLLVTLEQGKLAAAVALAEANFHLASLTRSRAEQMLANKTISQQEHDQAIAGFQANQATLEYVPVPGGGACFRVALPGPNTILSL